MSDSILEVLERVRTYKLCYWPYHNIEVNPYKLAYNGYVVSRLNTVECTVCHHTAEILQQNSQQFLQQVKNHQNQCIYKDQPAFTLSKQQLYLKMDEINTIVRENYLKKINIKYPVLDLQQFWNITEINKHTLNKIFEKYNIHKQQIRISFVLIFSGWKLQHHQNQSNNLECFYCGRILQLNNYDLVQDDKQPRQLTSYKKKLNPIDEHRYFCYWIQHKGWQVYLQHLWDKLGQSQSLFKRQRPQQTKKVRVQLDKYLEGFQKDTKQLFAKINEVMISCEKLGEEDDLNKLTEAKRILNEFNDQVQDEIKNPIKKIKINEQQ